MSLKLKGLGWSKKNIRELFGVLVSVVAFKQCQKLLKMRFCKLILPSEKGLPGAPKRLKPRSFGGLRPIDPHQGKQKTNKQKAKKSVPEEPSKWVFKRLKSPGPHAVMGERSARFARYASQLFPFFPNNQVASLYVAVLASKISW